MSGNVQPEYKLEFEIRSFDVDPACQARVPVFCKFMQEAAYFHAEYLGLGHTQLSPMNMAWVLSRMRLEMKRQPKWGETITLRTWPSGRDRLFYYRDFEFKDGNGEVILLAGTAWFVIDYDKRERVIPPWWDGSGLPVGPKVFEAKLTRLKSCGYGGSAAVPVNYGDLDQNGHVSNIRYIEWVLNSLTPEFHHQHVIQSLEVNYVAEAVYGHSVAVCAKEVEPFIYDHGILSERTDLFRARTVWKPV